MIDEKTLSHCLEGVIGDYLDNLEGGKYDLPYEIIEKLSKHVASWIKAHKEGLVKTTKPDGEEIGRQLQRAQKRFVRYVKQI